jgi:CRP-like cAMP-binding protein
MVKDKIKALKQTPLFGELNEPELRVVAEHAVGRRLKKDEILFMAGEEARGLYVVVEGSVRAFRESPDGREQVIHVERAGATLAEIPVFDGGAYPSTVAAEEDSILLFIDKRDVQRLFVEHPQIALAALKLLATRLRRCAALVETLSLKEVGQRLARFLLDEAKRKGKPTKNGVEMEIKLTNQQIAARIGTVREVVSRAFTRLQQDNLISLEGRRLLIPSEKDLAMYAGID